MSGLPAPASRSYKHEVSHRTVCVNSILASPADKASAVLLCVLATSAPSRLVHLDCLHTPIAVLSAKLGGIPGLPAAHVSAQKRRLHSL